jgi:hypothetical protein
MFDREFTWRNEEPPARAVRGVTHYSGDALRESGLPANGGIWNGDFSAVSPCPSRRGTFFTAATKGV